MVSGTYGRKREVQVQKIESTRLWRRPKLQVKVHSVGKPPAGRGVAVTKNSLYDIALPAFNEADDLHDSATLAFQWVDFVHAFDQPGPGRNRTGSRDAVGGFLHIERRAIDGDRCRLRLLGLSQLGPDAALAATA